MTIATALRYIFQVIASFSDSDWIKVVIAIASAFQIIAIIYFFYSIWGRVRASAGSLKREEKGEKF
jgi:hypothetical protein